MKNSISLFSFVVIAILTFSCKPIEPVLIEPIKQDTIATTILTADFNVDAGIGYPNVFGGGASANRYDVAVMWKNLGITTYRNDMYLNNIVPNTTVANYKANIGDVQNPANWNWGPTSWTDIYHNAGLKNLAIMSYVPVWLSCNGKDMYGVPKDFAVYKDIITKIYQHVKGKVDLVEISNEPDGTSLMSLVGSSYTSRLTAYRDMYYYASEGIRSVDATIPIGGPGLTTPWVTPGQPYYRDNFNEWPDSMLSDARIVKNVNFLSLHLYESPDDQSIAAWQAVAAKHGKNNMPIYVDEWNYGGGYGDFPFVAGMNGANYAAISYVGYRLTNFLVQHAAGANIFDLTSDSSFGAMYADFSLTPKMRTFYLLSSVLGLGKGESALKGISWTKNLLITNAACGVNSSGQKVIWLTNHSKSSGSIKLKINGLVLGTNYTASVYEASLLNEAKIVREVIKFNGSIAGSVGINFTIPSKSVIGLVIQ